jgi:hypothetical protein
MVIDLITYEIVELKPMLKVLEATAGKGGVCGSSILNRIFQKHLEDRFRTSRGWDEEVLEEALDKFEKVRFDRLCSPPMPLQVARMHKIVLTLGSCIWFSTSFSPSK